MPRPPGTPSASKRGGRVRGSLDRQQRTVVTAQMAADILDVYNLLGGPSFLYRWACENPSSFVNGPLSRLLPSAPKPDDEAPPGPVFNFNNLSDFEAARRVAFLLAAGAHAQQELQEQPHIEAEPADAADS